MIPLGNIEFTTDSNGLALINEKVAMHTCKTHLNPQLMFRQSFHGVTAKLFVGNWNDNGFWISRFKMQLYQFRPDIISHFDIKNEPSLVKITIRSSIGFSSLFTGLFLIVFFSVPFISFGSAGFLTAAAIMTVLYICLASMEYDKMLKAIRNNIVDGISRTKSGLDKL